MPKSNPSTHNTSLFMPKYKHIAIFTADHLRHHSGKVPKFNPSSFIPAPETNRSSINNEQSFYLVDTFAPKHHHLWCNANNGPAQKRPLFTKGTTRRIRFGRPFSCILHTNCAKSRLCNNKNARSDELRSKKTPERVHYANWRTKETRAISLRSHRTTIDIKKKH